MALNSDKIEKITFDSFTTIVDVGSSTRRILGNYVDNADSIADLWRFRAIDYRMVSTFTEEYATYEETTRDALEYALLAHEYEFSEEVIENIVGVFHELDVFDDVKAGMHRLANENFDLYILSNGNPKLLDSMIKRADIEHYINGCISADEIQRYKPSPEIYEHAAQALDTPIENIAHVASPWYDIYGAKHAGNQTVWVNRANLPWERFDGEPDLIVSDFDELATALI